MKRLEDGEGGVWEVTTETSVYVLDLDDRQLKRVPGVANGSHIAADGAWVELRSLPRDDEWVTLHQLVECRLGEPLFALVRDPGGGTLTWRRSTHVQSIRKLPAAVESSGGEAIDPDPEPPALREVGFYDKAGEAISFKELMRLYADSDYRFVAHTRAGDLDVVTAWIGVDQDIAHPQPLIFGTAVIKNFAQSDQELVTEELAPTEEQAQANHLALVARLEQDDP